MLHGPGFPPNAIVSARSLSWTFRILAAMILTQSLVYKFGSHPDSIMLFTELGVEPAGRVSLGIVELVVALLILYPRTTLLGGILGVFIMAGALFTHFFLIGIIFNNDGGKLFGLAVICFLSCIGQVIILKNQLISYIKNRYVI